MPPKGDFKIVPAVTHLRERVQKQTGRTALAGIPTLISGLCAPLSPGLRMHRENASGGFSMPASEMDGFLRRLFMVS